MFLWSPQHFGGSYTSQRINSKKQVEGAFVKGGILLKAGPLAPNLVRILGCNSEKDIGSGGQDLRDL